MSPMPRFTTVVIGMISMTGRSRVRANSATKHTAEPAQAESGVGGSLQAVEALLAMMNPASAFHARGVNPFGSGVLKRVQWTARLEQERRLASCASACTRRLKTIRMSESEEVNVRGPLLESLEGIIPTAFEDLLKVIEENLEVYGKPLLAEGKDLLSRYNMLKLCLPEKASISDVAALQQSVVEEAQSIIDERDQFMEKVSVKMMGELKNAQLPTTEVRGKGTSSPWASADSNPFPDGLPDGLTLADLLAMGEGSDLPEGIKIFLATPAYGGTVTVDYMLSVINLLVMYRDVDWDLRLLKGESIITVARNNLVMQFLESDATHLLFLDADVAFGPECIRNLIKEDKDVSIVPYPAKNLNEQKMQETLLRTGQAVPRLRDGMHYVVHSDLERIQEAVAKGSTFVEVDAGPTGCMLIKRRVFDVLREKYPDMSCKFQDSRSGKTKITDPWWRFFDTTVTDEGEFLGEDISFCKLWKATGGEIWADLGATMTHIGRQAFTGNMMGNNEK